MLKKFSNIILVGHSGSGKTTLGNILSKYLNKKFIDTDKEIEKDLSLSIKNVFKIYGENFFRNKENNFIKKISKHKNIILSTGAGIISLKENRNILSNIGLVIYIKSNINECLKRIIESNDRPLINKNIYKKKIEYTVNLFKKREVLYENISNIIIDSKNKSINKIFKDLMFLINKYKDYEKNKCIN